MCKKRPSSLGTVPCLPRGTQRTVPKLHLLFFFLLFMLTPCAVADPAKDTEGTPRRADPESGIKVGPDRKVSVYKLDTVELKGTTRMTAEALASELGLVSGTPLDDDLVMTTRSKLLGL